jgi:hypothetical protein
MGSTPLHRLGKHMFPCIVKSPVHGLVIARRTPNPNKLSWGSIIVIKNHMSMCFGQNFCNDQEKITSLKEANKLVLERKDRENNYKVSLHYGVKLHEHVPNYFQGKNTKNFSA